MEPNDDIAPVAELPATVDEEPTMPETAPEAAPEARDATARAAVAGGDVAPAAAAPPAVGNPNKKRKVALYLAYQGHGYAGMQRNPGVKTIEEELFRAVHGAGGVSDANNDERGFQKIHWMRAARTDKGVSAVGQVVSLMMVHREDIVDRINALLPDQIRVLGSHRVVKGFDARKACDKRRYEYILPAWMFDPAAGAPREEAAPAPTAPPSGAAGGERGTAGAPAEAEAEAEAAAPADGPEGVAPGVSGVEHAAAGGPQPPADSRPEPSAAAQPNGHAPEDSEAAQPEAQPPAAPGGGSSPPFVFDAACAARLTSILRQFEGTHNFHNFTVRTPHSASNAQRYILSFRCAGVLDIGGAPWVRMVVTGQSFMLHQIRKMVGTALAEFLGAAPPGSLAAALRSRGDVHVPMAPELGLFLDECYYEAYNAQHGALHGPLRLDVYAGRVAAFKAAHLYPHLAARDERDGVNAAFLSSLNEACYRFSRWPAILAGEEGARGGGPARQKRGWPAAAGGGGRGARGAEGRDVRQRGAQEREQPPAGGGCGQASGVPSAMQSALDAELSE